MIFLNIFNYLKINNKSVFDITPQSYDENYALIEVPSDIGDNYTLDFDIKGVKFKITK